MNILTIRSGGGEGDGIASSSECLTEAFIKGSDNSIIEVFLSCLLF